MHTHNDQISLSSPACVRHAASPKQIKSPNSKAVGAICPFGKLSPVGPHGLPFGCAEYPFGPQPATRVCLCGGTHRSCFLSNLFSFSTSLRGALGTRLRKLDSESSSEPNPAP